jgi:hypothetical protein
MILNKIKFYFRSLAKKRDVDILKNAIGHLCVQDLRRRKDSIQTINDAEFCIYSQWGEDGIISYLIESIPIKNKFFVEFGVENYEESNTRFLLIYYNWNGLIIDSNVSYIKQIKSSEIYWRYDLKAINAFITRDNINEILKKNIPYEDIGLLSIDIDGMDYWIWEKIDVIKPRIVVCEYNALFGYKKAIVVPYREDFDRFKAHYSGLYFGASLKALVNLAKRKGYIFVGCNKNGANAFFVRSDVKGSLKEVSLEEGYKPIFARQARDKSGNLTYISGIEQINLIKDLEVYDLEREIIISISEILDCL